MIGAEQCGRNSFLMELDTLYCDVIATASNASQVSQRSWNGPVNLRSP